LSTLALKIDFLKQHLSQQLIPNNYLLTIMVNIALGQSITGGFTTQDPLRSGYRLDEYDLTGFDDYRQLTIELTAANTTTPLLINLVDTITGNIIAVKEAANGQGKISLSSTTYPGNSYRLLVGGQSGSYTVSTLDGGRATSIITPFTARNNGDGSKADVGTVGQNGQFFSLASSTTNTDRFLLDIALGVDQTQLYAIGSNTQQQDILFKIDPSRAAGNQVTEIGLIRDSATNQVLSINLNSLAYGPNGQLYTIGSGGNNLYTVNPTTAVATSVRSNMPGDLVSGGDLVYDPTGNRFLVASILFRPDGTRGSSLWSIPLASSGIPTKIGDIGFPLVKGIDFENGQLKGFTGGVANAVGSRITIDPNTGAGTFETQLGNDPVAPINNGIGGATAITIGAVIPTPNPVPTPTPVPAPVPVPAPTPTGIPGTKGQSATQRTIDLTDYAGTLKADVTTMGDASYTNNVGFYTVTDALTGAIDLGNGVTVKPGEANYAKAAINNAIANSLLLGKNDAKSNLDIRGGAIYAPIVVAQGSLIDFANNNSSNGGDGTKIHAYFNYLGANPDKFDHFRLTGANTFAVEDQFGGGDRDFNDLTVNLNIRTV
jgi:Domain of unknown function (DUF4114)